MHEAAYSQAALPAPARVLGLNLRPYSLGHELWLIREQSPLSITFGTDKIGALLTSLPAAVIICSQKYAQVAGLNCDPFIGIKLRIWQLRLKRLNHARELAAFLEYRSRGALDFPTETADGQKGRPFGAPLLLSMFEFIRRGTQTDEQAWDHPYGLAQMRYAAWLESEGRLKIKNAWEIEHDRSFESWEKENQGSTLEVTDA